MHIYKKGEVKKPQKYLFPQDEPSEGDLGDYFWEEPKQLQCTGKEIYLDIKEVRDADADAQLVAEAIAQQLERRASLKRVIKRAEKVAMDMGVDGIKIKAGGRINGAEIARVEWSRQGKVPLHTLRENIDYGFAEANTTAGKIGIKVWICKKEDFQPRMSGPRRERGERKERERK